MNQPDTDGPTADDLRAKVFEDRITSGDWRVGKMDEDGGYEEVKVFTGPDARWQAIRYAADKYDVFDVIRLLAGDSVSHHLPFGRLGEFDEGCGQFGLTHPMSGRGSQMHVPDGFHAVGGKQLRCGCFERGWLHGLAGLPGAALPER